MRFQADCVRNEVFVFGLFQFRLILLCFLGCELSRRDCLRVSALTGCSVLLSAKVLADQDRSVAGDSDRGPAQTGATGQLQALMERLTKAPRRRDFKTVPMILNTPDLWDAGALDAVIGYPGSVKQVWDNTETGGPSISYQLCPFCQAISNS